MDLKDLRCYIRRMGEGKEVIKYLTDKPCEVHEVVADDGECVWIETGINPDKIFGSKRRSKWPFSEVTADMICERIAAGETLTKVCKAPGFPAYNIVSQWRREHPTFNESLKMAYEDRRALFEDEILDLARNPNFSVEQLPLLQTLRWAADRAEPKKALSQISQKGAYTIVVETGIRRNIESPDWVKELGAQMEKETGK